MVRKTLKTLLILIAIGLIGLMLFFAGSYYLLTGTPDWYQPNLLSPAQRQQAANSAVRKYGRMQNWAAAGQAAETRHTLGKPATRDDGADQTFTVSFSEDELNGFIYEWSQVYHWDRWYSKYVQDPMVVVQDGHLVLAGKLKDHDAVVSFHFDPKLDADGRLHLNLVKVRGGNLPLPTAVWSSQRRKLESALERRLPDWRKQAELQPGGAANDPAVFGGLAELALSAMGEGEGGDPVIFLLVGSEFSEPRKLPVRMTEVSLADHMLSLTVERLTPSQRADWLSRLRKPLSAVSSATGQ